MKEYIAEYIVPVVPADEKGKNLKFDFMNAKRLIQCKDCKHRDPEDKKCDCGHSIQWNLPRSDEWFCADAERKPPQVNPEMVKALRDRIEKQRGKE